MGQLKAQVCRCRTALNLSWPVWEKKLATMTFKETELEASLPAQVYKTSWQSAIPNPAAVPVLQSPVPSTETATVVPSAPGSASVQQLLALPVITTLPQASGTKQSLSQHVAAVLTPPASPVVSNSNNDNVIQDEVMEVVEDDNNANQCPAANNNNNTNKRKGAEEEEEESSSTKTPTKRRRRSSGGGTPGRARFSPAKVLGSSGTEENSQASDKPSWFKANGSEVVAEHVEEVVSDQIANNSVDLFGEDDDEDVVILGSGITFKTVTVNPTPVENTKAGKDDILLLSLARKPWNLEFLSALAVDNMLLGKQS